jgi:hypothetical protein
LYLFMSPLFFFLCISLSLLLYFLFCLPLIPYFCDFHLK